MDMTIDQQVALDEALVVYDVLKLTPFFKTFLVTADLSTSALVGKVQGTAVSVKHKDAKKRNEMYYPRFTNVIINFFMTKDPSIPRRNKFGAILPIELTNEDIRNSAAYKEYYAIESRAAPPKTKASMRKTQSSFDTTMPPPTAAGIRFSTSAKGKQPAKSSKAKGLSVLSEVAMTEAEQIKLAIKRSLQQTHISQASGSGADEGTGIIPGVPDVSTDESDEEISWKSSEEEDDDDVDDQSEADDDDDQDSDNDGDDFVHPKLSTHDEEAKDEENFDPIIQTSSHVEDSDDESNDDESHGMNVGGDEGSDAEEYRDVNINLKGRDVQMTDVHTTQILEDTHVTLTPVNPDGQQKSSFEHRLKTLEANFSEFMQTNQFAGVVSSILGIVDRYIDHQMNEAVKVVVQLQSDRLRDEAQVKNEDFINKLEWESARDVYSKRRIIAVIELHIVEWHDYKHLDWITMRRYDDKLYKFKEGDFKRLHIQDIEDMLLLLNRLMRIDELHKFSDDTLNDVWIALDECLKGIRMKYLPQTIWRRSENERAAAMIQTIDKQLKTRRIMRSLEKFVCGRLYEGDFRMLQRTI
nr:hypothetical protein [Tanacetum cinerariifolium]